jgi:hypothetical protein
MTIHLKYCKPTAEAAKAVSIDEETKDVRLAKAKPYFVSTIV